MDRYAIYIYRQIDIMDFEDYVNVVFLISIADDDIFLSINIVSCDCRQIRVGYDADILGLQTNPLDDIYRLADPDNISHIWKVRSF